MGTNNDNRKTSGFLAGLATGLLIGLLAYTVIAVIESQARSKTDRQMLGLKD